MTGKTTSLSPLGLSLRRYRAAHGLTLKTMADALGFSPSFLSAVEHAKKPFSAALERRILERFTFSPAEAADLQAAADASRIKFTFTPNEDLLSSLIAGELVRRLPTMSTEQKERLLAVLAEGKRK